MREGLRLIFGQGETPSLAAARVDHPQARRSLQRYAKDIRANVDLLHNEVEATRSILDQGWHDPNDMLEPALGPRLGPGLSIVSVGQATRADDRTVRVPVVLGDADGEISTLVLSIRLDPLVDETH